jgi:hypothetical protein
MINAYIQLTDNSNHRDGVFSPRQETTLFSGRPNTNVYTAVDSPCESVGDRHGSICEPHDNRNPYDL